MDWLKKAREAVEGVGREASKQAEILSLHNEIGKRQTELDRHYAEAGRRAKELVRARQLLDGEIKVILERTNKLEAEIMELRQQIQAVERGRETESPDQEGRKCPQCGQQTAGEGAFCESCGARLE
jgi:DNA repair exonuclease SbcCD ATPase subunit